MTLGRLAGYTTDLFRLITLTLTTSEIDMAAAWQPYTMADKGEQLTRFEENGIALSKLSSKPRMRPFANPGQ